MANPNIVSVTSIYAENGYNLSATTTATLLTVDADKIVKINNIICANVDGTNATLIYLWMVWVVELLVLRQQVQTLQFI